MTTPARMRSLKYLVTTLAQIADTLRDFELEQESEALDAVKRDLEQKFPLLGQQERQAASLQRRQ